jgi:hypothetical protein
MQRPARITSPLPHSKRTQPFRAAGGNAPTNRAGSGTVALGNDAHHTACRNRFVRQHVAEHRPERRARTSPSVSRPASSGSRLRRRSPRNAARDRATSRGGNADACWRFSPPAPLRGSSARAVETRRVVSPLAGRILALRSRIRWTEQPRCSGRDRCRGRARWAFRAPPVRPGC